MIKQETVHVAFRSMETGRYLFHVKWPKVEWERIEAASKYLNISVEDFIARAIREYAIHHS